MNPHSEENLRFAASALRGFEYREHVAQHHPDLTSLCRELGEAKVVDAAAREAWRFGYDFEGKKAEQ